MTDSIETCVAQCSFNAQYDFLVTIISPLQHIKKKQSVGNCMFALKWNTKFEDQLIFYQNFRVAHAIRDCVIVSRCGLLFLVVLGS